MIGIKTLLLIPLYVISIILITQRFIVHTELKCVDAILGFYNNTNICTNVYYYGDNIILGVILLIVTIILTYIIFKKGE